MQGPERAQRQGCVHSSGLPRASEPRGPITRDLLLGLRVSGESHQMSLPTAQIRGGETEAQSGLLACSMGSIPGQPDICRRPCCQWLSGEGRGVGLSTGVSIQWT